MPVARTPLSPVRPRLVWRPSSSSLPAPRPLPDPAPTDLARPCWRDLAGRLLLVAGALLVAFAAFQTWGTSLGEWRSQEALTAQLEQPSGSGAGSGRLAPTMATLGSEPYDPTSGSVATGPAAASTFAGNNVSPAPASTSWPTDQAMGRIEIPDIGLSKAFLQGVARDDLRQGPGHYPGTALPGHRGNVAIAGHRTTHGAPFADIDRLQPGDEIVLETSEGRFRYQVEAHTGPDGSVSGHVVVDPGDVAVLADGGDNRLTLTACHPKFSSRQRMVVTASLVGPALPDPADPSSDPVSQSSIGVTGPAKPGPAKPGADTPGADRPGPDGLEPSGTGAAPVGAVTRAGAGEPGRVDAGEGSLGWQEPELSPTLLWATIAVLVAHLGWIAGRLLRRPLAGYVLVAPVFLPVLFVCFVHLDRAIPAF